MTSHPRPISIAVQALASSTLVLAVALGPSQAPVRAARAGVDAPLVAATGLGQLWVRNFNLFASFANQPGSGAA